VNLDNGDWPFPVSMVGRTTCSLSQYASVVSVAICDRYSGKVVIDNSHDFLL